MEEKIHKGLGDVGTAVFQLHGCHVAQTDIPRRQIMVSYIAL
jgi:hypothetical protein